MGNQVGSSEKRPRMVSKCASMFKEVTSSSSTTASNFDKGPSTKEPLSKRHSSGLEQLHVASNCELGLQGQFPNSNKSPNSKSQPTALQSNLVKFATQMASASGFQSSGKISHAVLQRELVPHCPVMAKYLVRHFQGGPSSPQNAEEGDVVGVPTFVTITEQLFAMHTDKERLTFYLRVFGDKDHIERDAFMDFLLSAYQLQNAGSSGSAEILDADTLDGAEYLHAVVKSCFHLKDVMSICFISNWLLMNLPRLHEGMHKYVVHQLTTGHSQIASGNQTVNCDEKGVISTSRRGSELRDEIDAILQQRQNLKESQSAEQSSEPAVKREKINSVLQWLLKCCLPPPFLALFQKNRRTAASSNFPALNSTQLILQLMHEASEGGVEGEDWRQLYDSSKDGLSINRFQFHVFNYKGPTITILQGDNGYSVAMAADTEWRESCHFWGNDNSLLIQLSPEFRIVEKGAKLLYANFSIRGYPFGIQAGKDCKKLSMTMKPDFSLFTYRQIPCPLVNFVVWGCAPRQTQVAQTEFKQWEAKQCEKARRVNVMSAADWKENPDKYLLELAGNYRSYNT